MRTGCALRLMAMMFVQIMVFPVWFTTVVPYVQTLPGGQAWVPFYGMLMAIGMFASSVVCMFADRFLDSGKVLFLCNVAAAAALTGAFFTQNLYALAALLLLATFAIMPTWSLVSAVAMAHAPKEMFPYIRSCGSVGYAASAVFSIVAINFFGFAGFETTPWIFVCGAATALAAAAMALFLPPTPPSAKGEALSLVDALGLRAFSLLKDRSVFVLSVILLLSMVSFQWYMGYNTMYLQEAGFKYLALTNNLGQIAELFFMMLLPLLIRKLGFKYSTLLGIGALAFRYASFLVASKTGVHAFDFGGILVHGLIFGMLIVGIQMHMAEVAPPNLRNQAQGFVMFLAAGVGGFLSVGIFNTLLRANELPSGGHDWSVPFGAALAIALAAGALFALFYRDSAKKARSDKEP